MPVLCLHLLLRIQAAWQPMAVTMIGAMAVGIVTALPRNLFERFNALLAAISTIPTAQPHVQQVPHRSEPDSPAMGDILIETAMEKPANSRAKLAYCASLTPVAFLAALIGFCQAF